MGFLHKARAFVAGAWPGAVALPWLGERIYAGGAALSAPLSPQSVLALTAVYRCCSLLSEAASASVPTISRRQPKGGRLVETDTAAARCLATFAHSDGEMFAFSCALVGNGYLQIIRDKTGAPYELRALPPWRVQVELEQETRRVWYRVTADATMDEPEVLLPEADVVHARYRAIGPNRLMGIPPVQSCSPAMALALQSRDVQRALFSNLAVPGGVLTTPNKMEPGTARKLQEDWQSNFGPGGRGRVAVLTNSLEFQPIVFKAADQQLLEQVQASAADVARAFGVPFQFVTESTNLTFASAVEGSRALYALTLKNFAYRLADALGQRLLTRNERAAGATVAYDLKDLLVLPGLEQAQWLGGLVQAGLCTPNEVRNEYLGLEDAAGGDSLRPAPNGAPATGAAPAAPTKGSDAESNAVLHRDLLQYHSDLSAWYQNLHDTGSAIARAFRDNPTLQVPYLEALRPPTLWAVVAAREWKAFHGPEPFLPSPNGYERIEQISDARSTVWKAVGDDWPDTPLHTLEENEQ